MKSCVDRIKSLLQYRGMSAAELARRLRLSESTVQSYLRGKGDVPVSFVMAAADYFKVDISWLVNGEVKVNIEKALRIINRLRSALREKADSHGLVAALIEADLASEIRQKYFYRGEALFENLDWLDRVVSDRANHYRSVLNQYKDRQATDAK